MQPSFACVALMITRDGYIPIVKDPQKQDPLWKYPGGTGEMGESPEECIRREVLEETGIDLVALHPDPITPFTEEKRAGGHVFYVYYLELEVSHREIDLLERGGDGELVRWSTPQEILSMRDFLEGQWGLTRDILLEMHYREYS